MSSDCGRDKPSLDDGLLQFFFGAIQQVWQSNPQALALALGLGSFFGLVVSAFAAWIASQRADRLAAEEEAAEEKQSRPARSEEKALAVSEAASSSAMPMDGQDSLLIIFGTDGGTAERYAKEIERRVRESASLSRRFAVTVADAKEFEGDELADEEGFVVFVMATHTDGAATPSAEPLYQWVISEPEDPRSGNTLRKMCFAVFGLGNSEYEGHYNTVGRRMDKCLAMLGAARFCQRGEADASAASPDAAFQRWLNELLRMLGKESARRRSSKAAATVARTVPKLAVEAESGSDSESDDDGGDGVLDLEDMGRAMSEDFVGEGSACGVGANTPAAEAGGQLPVMLNERQRKTLTKQGYRIIGSHSAVKLCRWTKSMLRGRGGCYKHTFYGIQSHQCMEATPNLSCANRCTFCWRHNSHPVGREWKWQMDEAPMIVSEAIRKHKEIINSCKGVPDVSAERLDEAMRPRHCALSLVGEPINYPDINNFLSLLHAQGISTFLVSNAQFPDQLANLAPCTQLYISVDAPTRDALKVIDRPLFTDFWERFLACMDALREKRQRTVYRLTLVKGYNTDDLPEYVKLIQRGTPDFIEVKGVTFSGGKDPIIGMANVPWHTEVVSWVQQLEDALKPDYEIACEHEHSCCLVLARVDRFKVDGQWHTWIDYPRFIELANSGQPFTSVDYRAPTPAWAVYGAEERGFDPAEVRNRKVRRHRTTAASSSS